MNKLIAFVEHYKTSNPSGWRKVVYGLAAGCALVVLAIVFFVRENLRQREIARLNHEVAVLEQQAATHQTNATLSVLETDKAEHVAAANAAKDRADQIKNTVATMQEQHASNVAVINSIRSWSDVDAHVR